MEERAKIMVPFGKNTSPFYTSPHFTVGRIFLSGSTDHTSGTTAGQVEFCPSWGVKILLAGSIGGTSGTTARLKSSSRQGPGGGTAPLPLKSAS
jgi:hypothetical protein